MSETPPPEMPLDPSGLTRKQWFFTLYGVIVLLFWFWNVFFGAERYRGLAYNLGKSLVWPFQLFPAVGEVIGGLLAFAAIVWFVILDPDPRRPGYRDTRE